MTEPSPTGPVFTQHNHAGGVGAQGMEVTQNVGAQAGELMTLIARLRELAPPPGASGRDEYITDVEVLEDEAQQPTVRLSAWRRLRDALGQAATSVTAAGVVALGDQVVSGISG